MLILIHYISYTRFKNLVDYFRLTVAVADSLLHLSDVFTHLYWGGLERRGVLEGKSACPR